MKLRVIQLFTVTLSAILVWLYAARYQQRLAQAARLATAPRRSNLS